MSLVNMMSSHKKHDIVEFTATCVRLAAAAKELNEERDNLRARAEWIAGCELRDWSFGLVVQYIDLAILTARGTKP